MLPTIPFLRSNKFRKRFVPIPRKLKNKEFILWSVPLLLVFLSGLLIASTQTQADYAEWYQHWITGGIGIIVAIVFAQLPLDRLRLFLLKQG